MIHKRPITRPLFCGVTAAVVCSLPAGIGLLPASASTTRNAPQHLKLSSGCSIFSARSSPFVRSLPVPANDQTTERGSFAVYCNGDCVASGSGPLDRIKQEAEHYAAVYSQDGPVTVRVRRSRQKEKPHG